MIPCCLYRKLLGPLLCFYIKIKISRFLLPVLNRRANAYSDILLQHCEQHTFHSNLGKLSHLESLTQLFLGGGQRVNRWTNNTADWFIFLYCMVFFFQQCLANCRAYPIVSFNVYHLKNGRKLSYQFLVFFVNDSSVTLDSQIVPI